MITSSPEEARRLNAEVSDPLLVVVHDAEAILLEDSLILLFDFLHSYFRTEYCENNDKFCSVRVGKVHNDAGLPVSPLLTSVSLLPIGL